MCLWGGGIWEDIVLGRGAEGRNSAAFMMIW